jgi:cytoskeletal protein RodZ
MDDKFADMDEPTQPRETRDPAEEQRDRRITNIFLIVFFAVIVGSGLWLVNAMVEQKAIDDCASTGRRNCAPIDTTTVR